LNEEQKQKELEEKKLLELQINIKSETEKFENEKKG